MERMLIAERGTDWLRALRSLSLAHRPFTTLVQAPDDGSFLRVRPWGARPPRELVLVWTGELTADVLTARLALFRHIAAAPGATRVCIVADSDEQALASEAFLQIVRELAPGLEIWVSTLSALVSEGALASEDAARPAEREAA